MIINKPLLTASFLAIGAILATIASFVFGVPWLVPILGAAVPYPIFLFHVRHRQYMRALGWMLLWALFQSLAVGIGTALAPETAAQVILNGSDYIEEQLLWIRTVEGTEGSLRLFLPDHVQQYTVFCFLSLVTFGSAALVLGTYLLNYMNFYVAQLVQISVNPWLAALVGWPPWSVLRVVGFICTGVALTALGLNLVAKITRSNSQHPFPQRYLLIGIGFVVADIIVKATLAPIWQQLLSFALLG
ncbi:MULTISPECIES: hypothetical protein [Moorena]|uniref:Uncharacterized protein n=1 Tax=Moorena producens 3L TaxID=489825 RepID=F4XVH4_9CYAN|nr:MULTISPECIES: hypothetical protein [Moorena]NEQ13159.1 hypothetical protein [Moorena sp. SIO3E2]EGJ31522.1 hypothetical protein LYNGBM3L_38680 [Moorena producens 3L]NEP31325.1 hypothetical protein [Moorena sp. SIO3B2]NEP65913.1 hypothetical protein [Moorena sp. SIO3A5]NES42309.1 hypothetical protein [Moorena sp. SIO2C4]